jgi:hypothetical protein
MRACSNRRQLHDCLVEWSRTSVRRRAYTGQQMFQSGPKINFGTVHRQGHAAVCVPGVGYLQFVDERPHDGREGRGRCGICRMCTTSRLAARPCARGRTVQVNPYRLRQSRVATSRSTCGPLDYLMVIVVRAHASIRCSRHTFNCWVFVPPYMGQWTSRGNLVTYIYFLRVYRATLTRRKWYIADILQVVESSKS